MEDEQTPTKFDDHLKDIIYWTLIRQQIDGSVFDADFETTAINDNLSLQSAKSPLQPIDHSDNHLHHHQLHQTSSSTFISDDLISTAPSDTISSASSSSHNHLNYSQNAINTTRESYITHSNNSILDHHQLATDNFQFNNCNNSSNNNNFYRHQLSSNIFSSSSATSASSSASVSYSSSQEVADSATIQVNNCNTAPTRSSIRVHIPELRIEVSIL